MTNYSGKLTVSGSVVGSNGDSAALSGTLGIVLSTTLNGAGTGVGTETVSGYLNAVYTYPGGGTGSGTIPFDFTTPSLSIQLGSFDVNEEIPVSYKGIEFGVTLSGSVSSNQKNISDNISATFSGTYEGVAFSGNVSASGSLSLSPTLTTLTSFLTTPAAFPTAGVIVNSSGDLLGTTSGEAPYGFDGAYGHATVFEITNNDGSYATTPTILASFNGANGTNPASGLVADSKGDLFGTTLQGGAYGPGTFGGTAGDGTVFEIPNTANGYGPLQTIVNFNGTDGYTPDDLIVDPAGDLLGLAGIEYGNGNTGQIIFEITNNGGAYPETPTILSNLNFMPDFYPYPDLAMDSSGDIFGTEYATGQVAGEDGLIYEVKKSDGVYASTATALFSFDGNDGVAPSGLTVEANGDLLWAGSVGSLFDVSELATANTSTGYASTPTILASFSNVPSGVTPNGPMIADAAGDLFGTSMRGGTHEVGDVFEIPKTSTGYGEPEILTSFNNETSGIYPTAGLVTNPDGVLFGTTSQGPNSGLSRGAGTVFELSDTGFVVAPTPTLAITGASLASNQTTLTLSGTIDADDASLTISIYDRSTLLGTAPADASGDWTANVTVSSQGIHTLTAQASNGGGTGTSNSVTDLVGSSSATLSSGGQIVLFSGSADAVTLTGSSNTVTGSSGSIYLNSAQASVSGGGDWVDCLGSGDVVSLSGSNNNWDYVTAAGVTITLNGAQTSVSGGGDTINYASGSGDAVDIYKTGGSADTVTATASAVYLNSAQAKVTGGGDWVDFQSGSGNAVTLAGTNNSWDWVTATGATVNFNGAQATIAGGGNTIAFTGGSGNSVAVTGTGGSADAITASSSNVYMVGAKATVTGGGDWVDFQSGTDSVTLANTGGAWDWVTAAGGTVDFNGAQATVAGGGDTIAFIGGSGNSVALTGTGGSADSVTASNSAIYLLGAQAGVSGGGDWIDFQSGSDTAAVSGTGGNGDWVTGTGGTVNLNSAQSVVQGGGNALTLTGTGDAATLIGTGGSADTVNGSNSLLYLNGSQATVTGNSDTLVMTDATATASGNSDWFVFQAAFGQDSITGFNSTDTIQLAVSDFASWNVLQGDMAQSGVNTVITLDASDSITLVGVTKTSLTQAEFSLK